MKKFTITTAFLLTALGVSAAASAFEAPVLTPDEVATLQSGEVLISVRKAEELDHSPTVSRGGIDISASAADVVALLKECGPVSRFSSDIRDCMIEDMGPDGEYDIRKEKFAVSPILPKFKSEFRTDYKTDESGNYVLKVTRISGSLKVQDGRWDILSLAPDRSRVIYQAAIEPKLPIPDHVIREQTAIGIPAILKNIRTEAESDYMKHAKPLEMSENDQPLLTQTD